MSIRVVGAGLGRTGTQSLKLALEQLLGGTCYHMAELFDRPEDTALWHAAARGEAVDWEAFPAGVVATVDWPACAFWRELADAHPAALVLLSSRSSGEKWWDSFHNTIGATLSRPVPDGDPAWAARRSAVLDILARFTPDWADRDTAIAAYERHNAEVRAAVPAGRLIDWQAGDGWAPICARLGVEVPETEFPHTNTRDQFRAGADLDADV